MGPYRHGPCPKPCDEKRGLLDLPALYCKYADCSVLRLHLQLCVLYQGGGPMVMDDFPNG